MNTIKLYRTLLFIFSVFFLFKCASESPNNKALQDSLRMLNEKYKKNLDQRNKLVQIVKRKDSNIRVLNDSMKSYMRNVAPGGSASTEELSRLLSQIEILRKQNEALRLNYKTPDGKVVNVVDLSRQLEERKSRLAVLEKSLANVKSSEEDWQKKAKIAQEEKEKLEQEVGQIENKIGKAGYINLSDISVKGHKKGLGSATKKIKLIELCFFVNDNPLASNGTKSIYLVAFDPGGEVINENPDHVFQAVDGQELPYVTLLDIDYNNTQKLDEKCLYWSVNKPIVVGNYILRLYIDGYVAGETIFQAE